MAADWSTANAGSPGCWLLSALIPLYSTVVAFKIVQPCAGDAPENPRAVKDVRKLPVRLVVSVSLFPLPWMNAAVVNPIVTRFGGMNKALPMQKFRDDTE